jgi:hypothetical protein
MANITLNFNNPINVSIQSNNDSNNNYAGADIVYFKNSNEDIFEIGPCISLTQTSVTCDITGSRARPSNGDFIFFAKSPVTNTSGLTGYYAEVDLEINSTNKKELYSVGSEVSLSS